MGKMVTREDNEKTFCQYEKCLYFCKLKLKERINYFITIVYKTTV